ncbi:MAG: glycosyltransferase family 4 protein [Pirellulaceae bacterium]
MNPSVVFLNRSYYPDAEATGQLLTELCEQLAATWDVTVIAGQPNQNPSGVPFRRWGVETHRHVTIQRVWNARFPKRWLPGRLLNVLSYLVLASWKVLTLPKRPDILVVETDPPLLCLIGAVARWRYGCKLVVYLQDIYPDLGIALGKLRDGWWTRWLRRAFVAVYRRADRVVVLSRDMRRVLLEADVRPDRIEIIPNWTDCSRVEPRKDDNAFRRRHGLHGRFVVMYSGNMGLCQGLDQLLDAARELRDRAEVTWLLIGDGARRRELERRVQREQLKNVRFLDYQPHTQLADSLSAADLHLVPLDARVSSFIMPSKLYGILASGTPLIAVAPADCELAELVVEHGVGFVSRPDRPAELAGLIARLAEAPESLSAVGVRARRLAVQEFDRAICTRRFGEVLEGVLGRRSFQPVAEVATLP